MLEVQSPWAPKPSCTDVLMISVLPFYLDSERGNFKLFGLIYFLNLRKFELLGSRLLKKRVFNRCNPKPDLEGGCSMS